MSGARFVSQFWFSWFGPASLCVSVLVVLGIGCATMCGVGHSSVTANKAYEFGIEFLIITIEIHSKIRLESRTCHSNYSLA